MPIKIFLACLVGLMLISPTKAQDSSNQLSGKNTVNAQLLPTGRAISPAGDLIAFSGRPVDLAISDDQKRLFVKDRNQLRLIDTANFQLLDSISVAEGASLTGIATDSQGNIYFSTAKNQVHVYRVSDQNKLKLTHTIQLPANSFPCGLTVSEDEKSLFVCLSKKNTLAVVDLASKAVTAEIEVGIAPFDVIQIGQELVVSNIGGRRPVADDKTAPSGGSETVVDKRGIASTGTLSIVSLSAGKSTKEIAVGLHPSSLTKQNNQAIVCNTNQDTLSIVDIKSGNTKTVDVKPNKNLPFGSMPSSLCWLPDQKHLLVTLAGNNAVSVFKQSADGNFTQLGLIPTAWFPASVACSNKHIFVANIKGLGSRSLNRAADKGRNSRDYQGAVQRIAIADILNPTQLATWTKQATENSKLAQIVRNQVLNSDQADVKPIPIPKELGQPSLFKHVIYVIKENRTFDQVFGDYPQARSDASLNVFPRKLTPNHHALADRFGILDNYYCNGVLSADGHSWATEANVTPYLERAFGGFARSYTFGDDPITYSSTGFIWDHILNAGLSFRNYGEMDYAKPPGGIKYHEIYRKHLAGEPMVFSQQIGIERLRNYSCRDYPGWNMEIPDVVRMAQFLKEFREFEKQGTLPNFSIVYLPQDHLGAKNVTSQAHMADNDLALGQLVEAVSNSKFWKNTVIFVNEDDPQNGYDHIDGHRSICLTISPYSVKGVNHHFYNQTSAIRTMLHILGLPPMNQQDASAPLMRECFQATANFKPYQVITPETPLNQSPNKQSNWSPEERKWRNILATVPIERTGMKTETDEDNLNRFIWHDTQGWLTPYPTAYAGAHGRGLKKLGLVLDASGAGE